MFSQHRHDSCVCLLLNICLFSTNITRTFTPAALIVFRLVVLYHAASLGHACRMKKLFGLLWSPGSWTIKHLIRYFDEVNIVFLLFDATRNIKIKTFLMICYEQVLYILNTSFQTEHFLLKSQRIKKMKYVIIKIILNI